MNGPAPLPLPEYDEALSRILKRVEPLSIDSVALDDALGRVLREDVRADRDQPPFNRSAMDGFAVRSHEISSGKTYAIVANIPAGEAVDPSIDCTGGVAHIATGAALPDAYDATIQIELAHVQGDQVRFDIETCDTGRNIHRQGCDAKVNDVVLRCGQLMTGARLGIAAAVGCTNLPVTRLPRVTLLTTGDELRPLNTPTDQLAPQQIRNSNASMVSGLLAEWGISLHRHIHVPDDPEQTLAAAREALSESNLVLTTGGVSVGRRDYLPGAWKQLGLDVVLHGVAMQPGKPVFVAQPTDVLEKLVIGLPGNPVSALMSCVLFVQPVLKKWTAQDAALHWHRHLLANEVKPNAKRQTFRAGRLREDGCVEVIGWHGSGDLSHTATMTGVVRLPSQAKSLCGGDPIMYLPL